MEVSETRQSSMACVAFGAAACAAVGAIVGVNAVAKVAFGIVTFAGTRDLSLLPLACFYKEKKVEKFSRYLFESSAIMAVGCIGLRMATDANLLNYTIPVVAVTWLFAGPIVYKQGISVSLGEEDGRGRAWVMGLLYVWYK